MRILHVRFIVSALLLSLALPLAAHAQVELGVSINVAPPEIPVYDQPPLPADGYVWTPGFWAWGPDGYYWVPGTWVEPPTIGVLWTPGYWGWGDGVYVFHQGYWGPHVGFYGGVNYGFGYQGVGFEGGYWEGGHMFYNREVVNVGEVHVTNVYNKTVIVNNTTRVSYNGPGGVQAAPTSTELAAARERHTEPTRTQAEHVNAAKSNHDLLAKVNHGAPPIAATPKPAVFAGKGVVSAKGAPAEQRAPAARTDRPSAASANHAPAERTDRPGPANVNRGAPAERTDRPGPANVNRGAPAERTDRPGPANANRGAPAERLDRPGPASANHAPAERTDRPGPANANRGAPSAERADRPPAPHPVAAGAPPHPVAPVAAPHPSVQERAPPAPRGNPQAPKSREDKRD